MGYTTQTSQALANKLELIRGETRRILREYKALKNNDKTGDIHFFYLTAEGIMVRRQLESMYALYRSMCHAVYA